MFAPSSKSPLIWFFVAGESFGYVIRVLMKFCIDLFYFLFYRNLLTTRYTSVFTFLVLETQRYS